jgi:hypothetical protein
MTKQIRKTISMTSSTYSKLQALAAKFEGNVSMMMRELIERAFAEQSAKETK